MGKKPTPLDRQMGDRAPDVAMIERSIKDSSKEAIQAFSGLVVPTAKFSEFPFDVIARYVNHKVMFTVEYDPYVPFEPTEVATPWIVRKLT